MFYSSTPDTAALKAAVQIAGPQSLGSKGTDL